MKLRIKGNALRLRLTQGEMRTLAHEGRVESRTEFPGGAALVYRLSASNETGDISVTYSDNCIEFVLPEAHVRGWCDTDQVTVSAECVVPGGTLSLTFEKDFACLVPRPGEDETDHFPHPDAGRGSGRC